MLTKESLLVAFCSALALLFVGLSASLAEPGAGTYLVDSDADMPDNNPGDGICDTAGWLQDCTLHAAIQEANLDGVPSLIAFASPMEIKYATLPAITESGTTIDASQQWDGVWPQGRPGVKITPSSNGTGIVVIQADSTKVWGIEFLSCGPNVDVGVHIKGGSNSEIGGKGTGQRNLFLCGTGVHVQTAGSSNIINGNYFGTWDGVNPVPSDIGVEVQYGATTIEDNLFGSHQTAGIFVWSGVGNNMIQNNIIGANRFKNAALPNAIGISIVDADTNTIRDNFIAGNSGHGIEVKRAQSNLITGNVVGHSFSNLGNGGDGLHVSISDKNQITHNQIGVNGGHGLQLDRSNHNIVQRNGIGGNGQDGVYIEHGQENQIGGPGFDRNGISGNGGSGVHLATGTMSNTVTGNYVGLIDGGFDGGNDQYGVLVDGGARANRIGGLGAGEGNWIGYNGWSGIYLSGSTTQGNVVEGNVIGAPINWGWQAANGHHGIGIYDGAHHNLIGWGNTVVSSQWSGIAIVGSDDNVVWFNYLGTNSTGLNWGNSYYGVVVANSAGNRVFANEIAYNGTSGSQAGVRIDGGLAGNPLNANSIHDNMGAGIELANGGNLGLAAPAISQASCQGPVVGATCPGCTVEIFSDKADEGLIFQGTTTAHATTGTFSWSGKPNGPNITATSTHQAGATSPFSAAFTVGTCNTAPTAAFTVSPSSGTPSTAFHFDASGSSDAEDPTSALEVRWDWEDDGIYDTTWTSTKTASRTFAAAGVHIIRLQVQDTGGLSDAITKQVTVTAQPGGNQTFLPIILR